MPYHVTPNQVITSSHLISFRPPTLLLNDDTKGSVPIVLTEEESKPAEQFIFLCWTRHSHTLVQELMESTKQYVAEKQYTEALAALSEVIKIDPFFAEAYNRRATVHFGLKCADDCFADIERVRSCLYALICFAMLWYVLVYYVLISTFLSLHPHSLSLLPSLSGSKPPPKLTSPLHQ